MEVLVILKGVDALEFGMGEAEEPGDEPVVSLRQVDVDAERFVSAREGDRGERRLDAMGITAFSRV